MLGRTNRALQTICYLIDFITGIKTFLLDWPDLRVTRRGFELFVRPASSQKDRRWPTMDASFPMNFRDLNVPVVALHLFGCTKR